MLQSPDQPTDLARPDLGGEIIEGRRPAQGSGRLHQPGARRAQVTLEEPDRVAETVGDSVNAIALRGAEPASGVAPSSERCGRDRRGGEKLALTDTKRPGEPFDHARRQPGADKRDPVALGLIVQAHQRKRFSGCLPIVGTVALRDFIRDIAPSKNGHSSLRRLIHHMQTS
jgi:hypothetical protein